MNFLDRLVCPKCGRQYAKGRIHTLCTCGSPLLVRYDLQTAKKSFRRDCLQARPPTMWRYGEMLPVQDPASVVSLGEGFTPVIHARRLGEKLGLSRLYIKEEAANPTGSFKARGLCAAVSMAVELGIRPARDSFGRERRGRHGGLWRACRPGVVHLHARGHTRAPTSARRRFSAPTSSSSTGSSPTAAASWPNARNARGGTTSRPSRSRTGSKARRRWGTSWPSSSTGSCRTWSSIRRAEAPD